MMCLGLVTKQVYALLSRVSVRLEEHKHDVSQGLSAASLNATCERNKSQHRFYEYKKLHIAKIEHLMSLVATEANETPTMLNVRITVLHYRQFEKYIITLNAIKGTESNRVQTSQTKKNIASTHQILKQMQVHYHKAE